MTHRTTFALDEETIERLRRLSSAWAVSQAEVVRRSVELAERESAKDNSQAIAWCEFVSGPLDDEGTAVARTILKDRILPFSGDMAREAARFWNATGRRRALRVDAMVAAAAIVANAEPATANLGDFRVFEPLGLRLVG